MAEQASAAVERQDRLGGQMSPMGACLSCRRAKKCVVEVNPPCSRCLKAGRQCEFPSSRTTGPPRTQLQQRRVILGQEATSQSGERDVVSANGPDHDNQVRPHSHGTNQDVHHPRKPLPVIPEPSVKNADRSSNVPGVPITKPLGAVIDGTSVASNNRHAADNNQQPAPKRRRTGCYSSGLGDENNDLPSEQEMQQLFEIFQERLLRFIPIFRAEDFQEFSTMLADQKPLIQCVCYVTARFVPGGNAIRNKLAKPVSNLLLGISGSQASTASDSLAILQGLIVLYAYAQAVPGSEAPQLQSKNIYWRIKTFTEAHAIQLFIHRAIEGLRAALAAKEPDVSLSYCYKMYAYWLWLYTMSHYGSIVTRTPPTIRADASIRAASKLLKEVGMSTWASHLVAEIELCLSWEQASINETELGEWWCQPEPRTIRGLENKASLEETQSALNRWTQRWSVLVASGVSRGGSLDCKNLHICFVQFCITTYSLRPFKLHRSGGLLPAQKEAVKSCVTSASHVLTWALDLGPASKDRLRYLHDFGFVILSFCAFFILQAYQAFGPEITQADDYLDTVAEAAQLMIELAIDPKHAPAVYGSSVLLLLEKVTNPELRQSQADSNNLSQASDVSNSRSMNWMMSDTQGILRNEHSARIPDQTWDFTSLFPDMLWN